MAWSQVAVWLVSLGAPAPAGRELTECCSSEEHTEAAGHHSPHSATRWLRARGALRTILASVVDADPAALVFETEPGGKPAVTNAAGVHFNLSHAGSVAAIAIADRPVGIDIENEQRRLTTPRRLAARVFSPEGHAAWMASGEPNRAVLQEWTRTEALLKATGRGIAGGTRGAVERLTTAGWSVEDLQIPSLIGAVAARGSAWSADEPRWLSNTALAR